MQALMTELLKTKNGSFFLKFRRVNSDPSIVLSNTQINSSNNAHIANNLPH